MTHSRLRIAMFSDSALPILNGVSVSIDALVRQLRSRGHSVHIFTAKHRGHRDEDPNVYRFPAWETPWTRDYPLAMPPFYPMLRFFRRENFDVIHTHTPFTIGFVGLRWAESHEIPIVSTYHTLYDKYAHYIPFFPKRYVRYKIAKHTNFYYNKVDHVITPSEASKRWLQRHSVHRPITVIPTAVGSGAREGRVVSRMSLGIHPNERVLLYVGRIAREKNMDMLFEAVARIMQNDSSVTFMLVGDGPHREACAEHARQLGIGDRVRFIGYVPRHEVDRYYEASDLFVFASQTETQGLVVSEAMAFGLPAIVVQGGGAGASVQDGVNGFLSRNDVEVFADLVCRVLGEELLYSRLSEAASETAKRYSGDAMVASVEQVYWRASGKDVALEDRIGLF